MPKLEKKFLIYYNLKFSTNVTYLKAPITVSTMELEVSVIFYVLEYREVLSEGASRNPEVKSPVGHIWFMYYLL